LRHSPARFPSALIEYSSTIFNLVPADAIASGTPAGVGFTRKPPIFLKPGDAIEVEIENIGVLRNPVVEEWVGIGESSRRGERLEWMHGHRAEHDCSDQRECTIEGGELNHRRITAQERPFLEVKAGIPGQMAHGRSPRT